ncbi:trypsin-like peptidase domain-containing protein [Candidatus Njordibacter sp. Uisw_039]|uniref:trypsin-like peptidase domain-containing protein n=1 Tax=Candidatus Njordibacter sp. Uisw_039 TaxID=3230972 RepID=UPI003D56EA1B
MNNISLKICLVIAALFGGVAGASDLPDCPSDTNARWHNCFGTYTWSDGDKYVGEWKDNKNTGQGTYTYSPNGEWAGNKYVGEFKDGNFNGQGTYTWPSGSKYVGEYKDNKKNGQGTYTSADGSKYVGEYKDNKKNGQGTYTWPSGSKYVGEVKDGKKNGQGIYTYADGNKYVGEFKDGNFNGQGTYTYADGTVEEGIWKDDEFQYAKAPTKPVPVVKTPTKPTPVAKVAPKDDEVLSASSGSGFAVSSDGYVITNNHVIEGCQDVVVHTKQEDIKMRVITYDIQNDLALLKGDFTPTSVFPLSTKRPELLQDIYVAGYPFGKNISTSVKVTKGIISSLTGIGNNFSNIQIDAALQSGNSGGPILDDMGNLVGVAVSKLDAKYMFENFGSIPENTNFGIKSSVVRSVLDSSSVDIPSANKSAISKSQLSKMITEGTYYISCWMTLAQIEKVRSKKVLFSELD